MGWNGMERADGVIRGAEAIHAGLMRLKSIPPWLPAGCSIFKAFRGAHRGRGGGRALGRGVGGCCSRPGRINLSVCNWDPLQMALTSGKHLFRSGPEPCVYFPLLSEEAQMQSGGEGRDSGSPAPQSSPRQTDGLIIHFHAATAAAL